MEDHQFFGMKNMKTSQRLGHVWHSMAQLHEVEHNVNCVVVGFIADMELAEKKGIKGLDKARVRDFWRPLPPVLYLF